MKRALIVDDSRLARTVLSRLLEENGVASDTAESAQIALDYLKHSRPDVVFLDHNMPGIDGFQALDAIKKNPVTATIPVMMYTSEQGEVYVSQARALGALGVLPKTVQPVEVAKVLRTLHLIPERRASPDKDSYLLPASREADAPARPAPAVAPLDAESLRNLLDELLSEKAAGLREDFRRELQRLAAPAPPVARPAAAPGSAAQRLARRDRVLALATGLIVTAVAAFGYLYWTASASFEEATASFSRRLFAESSKQQDTRASTPMSVAARTAAPADVLGILEWGVNQGGRYGFGAVPLDDSRATVFAGLFDQLARLGFAGTVAIDVHTGRFCLNYGQNGALELAPPSEPAAMCEQIGSSEDDTASLGKRQSLAFANAVASAAARYPHLKIETASRGSAEPAVDYPASIAEPTAGAWNAVAAANQRVVVAIRPDPSASTAGERR